MANRLGRLLPRLGLHPTPLRPDRLLAAARRRTGLDDFGDDRFITPLAVLCDSIERQARLSPVGRLITAGRLTGVLESRLRATALRRRHPEMERIEIAAPIVIAGLQRTGTTLLHRLLAADPAIRALASWESIHPAPLPAKPWHRGDPRVGKAKLAERSLRYLAPDFFAVHPVQAEAPEEDVILLDYAFLSTVPEAMLQVPDYAAWLETQDQAPAYRTMKQLLQLLSWQRNGGRWVLKSPHHLEWLDTLIATFPDARIIQTHRDPLRTVPSTCSMIAHSRGVFSDDVDPREVGRHWSRKILRLVERSMQTRDREGDSRFLDVSYYDLVADPLAELERIYDFVGLPFGAAERARALTSRRANRQGQHGRHVYRLEDFGLDRADLDRAVSAYRARFDIRHE